MLSRLSNPKDERRFATASGRGKEPRLSMTAASSIHRRSLGDDALANDPSRSETTRPRRSRNCRDESQGRTKVAIVAIGDQKHRDHFRQPSCKRVASSRAKLAQTMRDTPKTGRFGDGRSL
ncbi:hypothetical protein KM043_004597 [Ampulex compressa]|nr:hypothetical protein KM043_004597 [Ampulex compressa]